MIEMPRIDLSDVLPIVGLALIAVVCVAALLVRSLLHSRVALLIAVVIGMVVAGPTLAYALAQIVGALVPLLIVACLSAVGILYLVQRNPELLAVVRDVATRKTTLTPGSSSSVMRPTTALTLAEEDGKRIVVIDNPPQARDVRRMPQPTGNSQRTDRWGF
jgi:hypothetical protein